MNVFYCNATCTFHIRWISIFYCNATYTFHIDDCFFVIFVCNATCTFHIRWLIIVCYYHSWCIKCARRAPAPTPPRWHDCSLATWCDISHFLINGVKWTSSCECKWITIILYNMPNHKSPMRCESRKWMVNNPWIATNASRTHHVRRMLYCKSQSGMKRNMAFFISRQFHTSKTFR